MTEASGYRIRQAPFLGFSRKRKTDRAQTYSYISATKWCRWCLHTLYLSQRTAFASLLDRFQDRSFLGSLRCSSSTSNIMRKPGKRHFSGWSSNTRHQSCDLQKLRRIRRGSTFRQKVGIRYPCAWFRACFEPCTKTFDFWMSNVHSARVR